MSGLLKRFLATSFTVFGGLLYLAVGQIIKKYFVRPVDEQGKPIGEIADKKKCLISSEGRKMEELYKMLLSDRDHESKLFWTIFGVMNIVNGALFVFVTGKPND